MSTIDRTPSDLTPPPIDGPEPTTVSPRTPAPRGAVLCGIVALSGFIFYQSPSLWDEFAALQEELSNSRNSAVVGYVGISPHLSAAQPPGEDWFRDEGDRVRLWAGWDSEAGHRWFIADRGDLDHRAISELVGRDLFRGIDRPLVELGGGPISDRIPGGHQVDTMNFAGQLCAYPVALLDKVMIVNDEVRDTPVMILFSNRDGSSVFEAALDGDRRFMGFAGYIYKGRPLLYERSSEGLWIEEDRGLIAISGPDRGRTLGRLGRMHRVAWGDWDHLRHAGRVVVGADRSAVPATL